MEEYYNAMIDAICFLRIYFPNPIVCAIKSAGGGPAPSYSAVAAACFTVLRYMMIQHIIWASAVISQVTG